MTNRLILDRLESIQNTLAAAYEASKQLKSEHSTVTGTEREIFVASFLREMFPPQYRFGSGIVTDAEGHKSSQLDIVIELPFAPSFSFGQGAPRIYLAETVGAVFEVKSKLDNDEWDRIEKQLRSGADSYRGLKQLRREVRVLSVEGVSKTIPAYVVGYRGYERIDTLIEQMETRNNRLTNEEGQPDPWLRAVLQIQPPFFVGSAGQSYEGTQALGAFVHSLHFELHRTIQSLTNISPYFDLTDDE